MTETEKKALEQAVAAAGRRMQDYAIMAEDAIRADERERMRGESNDR